MPKLIITDRGRRSEHNLADAPIVIGRDAACDVVIADSMSSRKHCRFTLKQDVALIEDLGSSNGTLLNGRRVQKAALTHGDVVKVGEVEIGIFDTSSETKPAILEEDLLPTPAPDEPAPAAETPKAPSTITVEVVAGPARGIESEIGDTTFTIGRKNDNDLALADPKSSGLHARVSKQGENWVLEDLDSGNGVIVAGRRVKRIAIANGLRCVLGESELIFRGEGLRDAPVASAAGGMGAAGIGEGLDATRRLEIDTVPTRSSQSQALFTTIFMGSFLVLLYYGFVLVSGFLERNRLEPDPENLLANSSFEAWNENSLVGWSASPDSVQTERVDEVAPHGQHAVRLVGNGTVVLENDARVRLTSPALRVGADLENQGFSLAGIRVDWLIERGNDSTVLSTSYATVSSARSGFSRIEQTLEHPTWASPTHARISLFGIGSGVLTADRVRVVAAEVEGEPPTIEVPGGSRDDRPLRFAFDADATLSVRRGRDLVVRRIGLGGDPRSFDPGQALSVSSSPPKLESATGTISTSFRYRAGEEGADRSVFVSGRSVEGAFKLTYRIADRDSSALQVRFDFDTRALDAPVNAFLSGSPRVEGGTLEDLDGELLDEWIIGEPSNQIIVTASQPARARFENGSISLEIEDRQGEFFDLVFSAVSKRERQLVATRRAQIESAKRDGRAGVVITTWRELKAQLPWRSDLVEEANREIQARITEGREELNKYEAYLKDFERFGSQAILDQVRAGAESLAETYEPTEIADDARSLLARVDGDLASKAGRDDRQSARGSVTRAQKYFDDGFSELGRYYAQYALDIGGEDPDVARQARQLLERYRIRNQ